MLGSFSRHQNVPPQSVLAANGNQELTNQPTTGIRLEDLSFRYPLRQYQKDILALVDEKFSRGERQLHLVAPPGAGKTIIGLQLVTTFKRPSLILCPNTTIQSQWGQKLDLFVPPDLEHLGVEELLGTHEDKPLKPITVLTYQVLSTPGREQEYLEEMAHSQWAKEISRGRQLSGGEAELRILEIMQNNPREYQKELSRHVSRLRKKLCDVMSLNDVLHPNALKLLQALRRQKFQVVIFDECHHLTDYWAAIMTHLVSYLDDAIVIGLTGTPPEGKSQSQETRYLTLVGDIDYQVPTPALVKEGGLAPFQDLVLFTHPTEKEYRFLEQQHDEFHKLIAELTGDDSFLAPIIKPDELDEAAAELGFSQSKEPVPLLQSGVGLASMLTLDRQVTPSVTISSQSPSIESSPPSIIANQRGLTGWEDDMHVKGIMTGGSGDDFYAMDFDQLYEIEIKFNPEEAPAASTVHDTNPGAVMAPASGNPEENSLPALTAWVMSRVNETFYDEQSKSFRSLISQRPELAVSCYRYLHRTGHRVPSNIPAEERIFEAPTIDDWMAILEDFASHKLKTSNDTSDHELYDRIRSAVRKLGYGITEQGLRKQASPIDRVLAFSMSKSEAVCRILECEYANLQDRLRAVVVTDFERMSATTAKALKGVIDEETGGAIATLQCMLKTPVGAYLNPCLVTGSLLFVDKRIRPQFVTAMEELLAKQDFKINLTVNESADRLYSEISSSSTQWEARLYVALATTIFERGITRCLVGTRGLFGEGWDSQSLNTLIDLTTTTSPVSVKQLRGRSLRIHTNDPLGGRKVANNWDVVCIAPSLEKGLNDYQRFVRKHDGFFGIAGDGQIECGVGHVHPAFSELTPIEVFASAERFNEEMLNRCLARERIYELWKVGSAYGNRMLGCVDLGRVRKPSLTPPHLKRNLKYREHARQLRSSLVAVWAEHMALGTVASGVVACLLSIWGVTLLPAVLPIIAFIYAARKNHARLYKRHLTDVCEPYSPEATLENMGIALLVTLQKMKIMPAHITRNSLRVTARSDGSYRVFLDDVEPAQSRAFTSAFKEMMAPVSGQPYLMPKYEYSLPKTGRRSWLGREQDQKSEFFELYLKERAVPRIAAYHPVPRLLARSSKGRLAFQASWNKYVSPGFLIETETRPKVLDRYFGIGPSLAERLLWE